jgi:hypothetical protein
MKTTHHSILFEDTEDYHVWLNVQIDWATTRGSRDCLRDGRVGRGACLL